MSIELVNVSKAFGETQVLRGLSERFAQGEAVCVMGRSGLGKTTLASIVMGLEKPDAGAVRGAKGKRFAAAFQEDRLVERLSAQGNLRFACGAALDEPRMAEAFAAVGLTPQDVEKPVGALSGGQRRRVALLRALLAPADVVVLDEPFKGLDEAARQAAASPAREPALLPTAPINRKTINRKRIHRGKLQKRKSDRSNAHEPPRCAGAGRSPCAGPRGL